METREGEEGSLETAANGKGQLRRGGGHKSGSMYEPMNARRRKKMARFAGPNGGSGALRKPVAPTMLAERSKSEGAMVHSHGYLVVREGGRVERAPVEACEDDIVVVTTVTTPEDEPSTTLDGRRTLAHHHPHNQKKPSLASTLSNLDKLRQSALNYFDFQPPNLGSPHASLVGHRSTSALLSVSSPAAAANGLAQRIGTPSPPPQSCLSPRSFAVYEREDLPETNLYAAAVTSTSSLDLSSDDSDEDDDGNGNGESEDGGESRGGGGGARPTPIEREARGDGYEADDLLDIYTSTTATLVASTSAAATTTAPPGQHQQNEVVFEEGELGGYDTGGDSDSRFTTDESSDDEEEGSNDEDDYETPDEEDEEWDTSEEEEMERTLRSIDRGDLGRSSDSIWNQRFQGLVRLRDDENKYQQLAYLAHDFQHAAEVYGRIIISERYLQVEQKTIKPLDIGGIAGGEKFIVQSILFKYALDTELAPGTWMYGGDFPDDSAAMKAAGHELRSLARIEDSAHARAEGLMLPLETVVDYRGFRLLACSVLPISHQTICYGSHDGGRTVHTTYPLFNRKFKAVFSRLNLKGHRVRNRFLYGPGDIEGHWGADGKLYLLDFSRVYPPEDILHVRRYFPSVPSRGLFYRMLRPELVGSYSVPLCSDACSRWIAADKNAHVHNLEVADATRWLLDKVVPDLALELTFRCIKIKPDEGISVSLLHQHMQHILHRMHTCGVNMRYLGLLRSKFLETARNYLVDGSSKESASASNSVGAVYSNIMFTEMAARVGKNFIRALLREKMKQLKVPSSEPYRQLVLNLFNLFSGQHHLSTKFWTATQPTHRIFNLSAQRKELTQNVGSTIQRTTEEEDRGLEYYIYQQSIRNERKRSAMKIEKRNGFRQRPTLQSAKPIISGDMKRIIEDALSDDSGEHIYDPAGHDEVEGEDTFYIGRQHSEEGESVSEDPSHFMDQFHDEELLNDLLPMKLAIRSKFGKFALTPQEWESQTRDKPLLYQGLFFYRLCEMLGIVMSNQPMIFQELNIASPTNPLPVKFEFLDPHLLDLSVKVKHMHLIASCEGMALFMKSARLIETKISLTEEERKKCGLLLTFAREKFEFALKSITDSVHTLLHLAKVVYFLACYSSTSSTSVSGKDNGSMGQGHQEQLRNSHGNDSQRKGGDGGKTTSNKRSLLDASLKYYEQAINILKKRDNMAALLAKKSKGSKGDLLVDSVSDGSKTVGQRKREDNERKDKKQIDVNQDLLCKAALEMLTVLCEMSVYASMHAPVSTSGGTTIPRERRRIWGSAWDLLQEALMKYPIKLKREFEIHTARLMRSHNSAYASQQNECKLYNYLKVGRLGVVIASLMQLESLRIIKERLLQGYYYDLREKERVALELRLKLESEERERLRVEEATRREEEQVRTRFEERCARERREELKRVGATFRPLRQSVDHVDRGRAEDTSDSEPEPAVASHNSDHVSGNKTIKEDLSTDPAVAGTEATERSWEGGATAVVDLASLSPMMRSRKEAGKDESDHEDEPESGGRGGSSSSRKKAKLGLKKAWRKSMVETTQTKPLSLSRSIDDSQVDTHPSKRDKEKEEKKRRKKEKKDKKSKMKPRNEEALAQLGLLDKRAKKKKKKKKDKSLDRKASPDASADEVQKQMRTSGNDKAGETEDEDRSSCGLDSSQGETTDQLDEAPMTGKLSGESESDTNSGGSGGSESEGGVVLISPEMRGRMGLLKSIQKRRAESSESKKAKVDTARRVRGQSSSSSSEENQRAPIPISLSLEEERSRSNSAGASFLPSFGKGRKNAPTKEESIALSAGGVVAAAAKGKTARAKSPTTVPLLFHTPITFLASLDIAYDVRSFASVFREKARWRVKDESGAYPFLFSTFDSTFYDSVSVPSPADNSAAHERENDRREWERLKLRKKSYRAAEKYVGEDIFLSWGGRYLAAKNDGSVYLSHTMREAIWRVETCQTKRESEESLHVTLRSVYGKYLSLADTSKGMVMAKSVRATDAVHQWEWTAVQAADVAEATSLRSPLLEKFLCPLNKRGNVVTAAKDSVAVNKGEYWSVRLANVNRIYLRASAHGKYLRSRNLADSSSSTESNRRNKVTTTAFVPSYIHDAWWVEMHPTDSHKIALRSHEGNFLIPQWGGTASNKNAQQPLQNVELDTTSPDPYYFTVVPFDPYNQEEKRRQARLERARQGPPKDEDGIERELDTELAVVLYAEREKGPGGFLSANAHGQVHLTSLSTSSSSPPSLATVPSPSASPSQRSPLSGGAGSGGEAEKREEALWTMRWYRPKWPATLAHLYAELHEATVAGPVIATSSLSSSLPSTVSASSSSSSSHPATQALSGSAPPPNSGSAPFPAVNSGFSVHSADGTEPENSSLVSVQLQAVLQRMVDRARFHVQV